MMSATSTSSGRLMSPAISRGTTRYLNGLVESVVSASICSVTRMVPISAAIAAPIAAGDHQPGEHRAELAGQREHDHVGDGALRR